VLLKIKLISFIGIFLCLFFNSCRKDLNPSWETSLTLPLAKTSLTINDIVTDTLLSYNPDHSISLVYRNNIYSFLVDSIFPFPDTVTSSIYTIPFTVNVPPGQILININDVKKLKLGSAKIFLANIHSGNVVFKVINKLKEGVICNYKISSANKNGACFEINEYIPSATNSNLPFTKQYDVSGYKLDLRGPNGTSSNKLITSILAKLNPNGSVIQVTPQDSLIIFVSFENLKFDYAKGYFGNSTSNFGPDTTKFNLFNKIISGNLNLQSIKANLYIENYFGIDATVTFNNLTAINSKTNQNINLIDPLIGKPINITRAVETGLINSPVSPFIYNYNLSNSNVLKLIQILPDNVCYSAKIDINPLGNVSGGNDFMYNGYGLKSYIDIDIPLSVIADNITLMDTVAFNLTNNLDDIIEGVFYLNADNGFPFHVNVSLLMLNEYKQVIDSLISNQNILAAGLNASYMVTSPKKSIIKIPLTSEKIYNLKRTKYMVIKAIFNTASQVHYIKLYDYYRLNLNLTGSFNYLFNNKY